MMICPECAKRAGMMETLRMEKAKAVAENEKLLDLIKRQTAYIARLKAENRQLVLERDLARRLSVIGLLGLGLPPGSGPKPGKKP